MSKFCDLTTIELNAGRGGNGSSHFRREKYVDRGGPDGGDGGRGGNIVFQADRNINTLIDFHTKKKFQAEDGGNGGKQNMHGKDGEDLVLKVPVGTIIKSEQEGLIIADLTHHNQVAIIAKGGRGGLGNTHFKSSTNQAPTFAEKGEQGQKMLVDLELKLVANVGIIGVPSAGKSTLISRISNCKPKIADYPFTTLIPNLGLVQMKSFDSHTDFSFVVTDIPGLIEGASEGKGLGFEFLRHVSRNQILIHLLDATRNLLTEDFRTINHELVKFDPELGEKEQIVAINKIDAVDTAELKSMLAAFKRKNKGKFREVFCLSAVTGEGLSELMFYTASRVEEHLQNQPEPVEYSEQEIDSKINNYNRLEVKFVRKKIDPITGKTRRTWQVKHERFEQVVKMTDPENREGMVRVYHFFHKLGIKKALQKLGAQPGDRVRIGESDQFVIPFKS